MKKALSFLIWTLVFLVLLVFIDQALTRVPAKAPLFSSLQDFYQDFRNRLLGHAPAKATKPVPPAPRPAKTPPPPPVVSTDHPQFIYVDREGQLQFADSLEEIPTEFRGQAQKLAQ